MPTSEPLDRVLELLRLRGGRVTTARRAILQALLLHREHLTAEQLTAEVHVVHPDISESTVYRFLDDLETLGVVDHVHLGHGPAVYHLFEDRHQHLVCESCGQVVEIPAKTLDPLRAVLSSQFRFELEARHFALPGYCEGCAPSARATADVRLAPSD